MLFPYERDQNSMDMVREVLQVLNGQNEAITMRHIAHHTGFSPSTLVGVMMGMINQGYVTEVLPSDMPGKTPVSRCTCACCTRHADQENTSSLDRRIYQICERGVIYLIYWADLQEK